MASGWNVRILTILFAGVMVASGCASGPASFDSPEAAVDAFVEALRANEKDRLREIFGSESEDVMSSGDPISDQAEIKRFLAAYEQKHSLQRTEDVTLLVGPQEWPFPVPIVQAKHGYVFDTGAGKDEILNRRIGRNELSAQQVCLAIVDAQREYVASRPMGHGLPLYARKLLSDPGTRNGLYWPTAPGEPMSPLGELVARAAEEGYGATRAKDSPLPPYHGYRYRLLTAQGAHAKGGSLSYEVNGNLIGGFAVVAYPAQYGNSGIATFMTNHEGVIYERDLGPDTDSIARQMAEFDPGPGWKAVDLQQLSYAP